VAIKFDGLCEVETYIDQYLKIAILCFCFFLFVTQNFSEYFGFQRLRKSFAAMLKIVVGTWPHVLEHLTH